MKTTAPSGHSRIRPRFSLLTILFLFALVACGITIWQLWREVGPIRAEVSQWRNEYGALTIDDKSKIHAVQLRTNENLSWIWKVWIPEGQSVRVAFGNGNVPGSGFPAFEHGGRFNLDQAGENKVRVSIRQDAIVNEWNLIVEAGGATMKSKVLNDQQWFTRPAAGVTSFQGVTQSTTVADANDSKFLLGRFRANADADNSAGLSTDAGLPGFIIWLEWQ